MIKRTRSEPSKEEVEIRRNAIRSGIKRDFLSSDITYVDAKEMPFLVGKIRQTDDTKVEIRNELKNVFDASSVPVGNGRVAIVKRVPTRR
jgi:hypothetical protein